MLLSSKLQNYFTWNFVILEYFNSFSLEFHSISICTINSKINGTTKSVYLPISKLHLILAVANSLANNNITISYYVQVNSRRLKSSVASKWAGKHFWGYHVFCCWCYSENVRILAGYGRRAVDLFKYFNIISITASIENQRNKFTFAKYNFNWDCLFSCPNWLFCSPFFFDRVMTT